MSKPGAYTSAFHQTCSISHGELVGLRVRSENLKSVASTQLLAGFRATLEIREQSATNVVDYSESDTSWKVDGEDGLIPIFSIRTFKKGDYEARFTVISGAPAIAGIPQRLEGRYLLCGLEMMPAFIAKALGVGCFVIASIIGSVALFLVYRNQPKSNPGL